MSRCGAGTDCQTVSIMVVLRGQRTQVGETGSGNVGVSLCASCASSQPGLPVTRGVRNKSRSRRTS